MGKTICDWSKKDLEKKQDILMEMTQNACLFCSKCGRVANTKKVLCKPKPFVSIQEEQDNILPFMKIAN